MIFGHMSTADPVSEYDAACAIGERANPTAAAAPRRLSVFFVSIAILLLSITRMARSRPRWGRWVHDDVGLEANLVVHALIAEVADRAPDDRRYVRTCRAGVAAFSGRALAVLRAAPGEHAAAAAALADESVTADSIAVLDGDRVRGIGAGYEERTSEREIRLVELLHDAQDAGGRGTHAGDATCRVRRALQVEPICVPADANADAGGVDASALEGAARTHQGLPKAQILERELRPAGGVEIDRQR